MAMRWFQRLLPREDKFFDLFESHSQLLVAGADALQRLFQGGDQVALYCRIIIDKEDEADQMVREISTVRRTFITPFDRSDIQELIQSMDDAIDQMN